MVSGGIFQPLPPVGQVISVVFLMLMARVGQTRKHLPQRIQFLLSIQMKVASAALSAG